MIRPDAVAAGEVGGAGGGRRWVGAVREAPAGRGRAHQAGAPPAGPCRRVPHRPVLAPPLPRHAVVVAPVSQRRC